MGGGGWEGGKGRMKEGTKGRGMKEGGKEWEERDVGGRERVGGGGSRREGKSGRRREEGGRG